MAQIALTTIFSPPSSCFDNVYTSQGGGVYVKDVSFESSECYPSAFRSLFSEQIPYSPGVCPSGYSYDSTTPYDGAATAALCCPKYAYWVPGDETGFADTVETVGCRPTQTEAWAATAALCCPNGMSAYADGSLGCNTQVDVLIELTVDGDTTTINQGVLADHGVYIAWGDDDRPSVVTSSTSLPSSSAASEAAPASSTSLASSTSSTTTTSSTRSSTVLRSPSSASTSSTLATSTTSDSSESPEGTVSVTASDSASSASPTPVPNSLSTGAKAGIGVGVSAAALAFIAVGAFFVLRRRKRRQEPPAHAYDQPEMVAEKRGPDAVNKAHISELSNESRRSELMGWVPWMDGQPKTDRAELDGR